MQDGTFVGIRNRGFARPAPGRDSFYTGQSTPVLEAPMGSPHDWMNTAIFTCSFTSDLSKGEVRLHFHLVEPNPST
jgi:hypothetical protein